VRIFIPKSIIILILVVFTFSAFRYGNAWFEFSKYLEIFSNVYKTVQEDYVDDIPPSELAQTAIKSMLKALDPYTVFYSEYQAEEAMIERQGEYGGVGCRIAIRQKQPMVVDIEKEYGFDKAGVQHGDILLKIDDKQLKNLALDELMHYFRGAPNSTFKLKLLRHKDTLEKTITRSHIEQKSVSYHGLVNQEYGYIKLDEFGRDCAKEIADALKNQLDSHHIKGLILDLRNNGGGLLNEAVNIVGLFVPKNTPIVTLRGAHKEGNQSWNTSQEPLAPNLPLVVLINGASASASEVVSGSLQDLDRAVIIGSQSFGKGLVQNYKNLPYRTQMKITTARYHIPSGRCIQKINYSKTDNAIQNSQIFKTKKGRVVTDGNGVLPDINIQTQNEHYWVTWMQKEYVYFDYVNRKNNTLSEKEIDDAFVLLSDFTTFATQEGSKRFQEKLKENISQSSDSLILREHDVLNIHSDKLSKSISQNIKENSPWHLYELRKSFYERRLKKSQYHQKMLHLDPLIAIAKNHLNDPQKMQKILQP
jgi:carboxyl-terminal processing protease